MRSKSRKRKRGVSDSESRNDYDDIEITRNRDNSYSANVTLDRNSMNVTDMECENQSANNANESMNWAEDDNEEQYCEPSMSQFGREMCSESRNDMECAKLNVFQVGTIESITLNNFMCHNNFHLEFGPRINFIVGRNGSGKSAVLNAIVVGLGGRATTTNRGKGMASFIKTGQSQAKVIIKLCNDNKHNYGKQGFCAEKYGKSVIIERTIYSTGASLYKTKSHSGSIISDKKQELDDIIRYFNIQVDNPICILNQEVSRNFLNTKNPADKYKFFMKATLLEDMKNDYTLAQSECELSVNMLKEKDKVFTQTSSDVRSLGRKVKMFEDLENHKEKFDKLNNEALWALVNERKQNLLKSKKDLSVYESKIECESAKIEEYQQNICDLETNKESISFQLQNINSDAQTLRNQVNEHKQQKDSIRENLRKTEIRLRIKNAELKDVKEDELRLQKKINDLEIQYSDESHNNRKLQIKNLEDNITKQTQDVDHLLRKKQELTEQFTRYNQEKTNLSGDLKQINDRINANVREIGRISNGKSERLHRYGLKYPQLIKQIDDAFNRKKFKKKPLGPIGEFIELKDYKCALAVEVCLKNLIFAFCCDNSDDAKQLRTIMKNVFGNDRMPTIITRKFVDLHDVSDNRVESEDFPSFLQLMSIKKDAIANCLIDQLRIEQILFIPEYKIALDLLIKSETAPHNCYQAYTSDGSVMYPQKYNSDFKCYANNKRNANFLVQNTDHLLENLKSEKLELENQRKTLTNNLNHYSKTTEDIKMRISSSDSEIKNIKHKIVKMENDLKTLQSIGDAPPVEISTLEEDLQNLRSKKEEVINEVDAINNEIGSIDGELEIARQKEQEKLNQYDKLLTEENPMREKLEKVKNDISTAKHAQEKHKNRLNEITELKYSEDEKLKKLEEELQRDERTALEKSGQVIETRRASKTVLNEIRQLQQFLAEQENTIGNKDEIYAQYEEMKDFFRKCKNEITVLTEYLKSLQNSLNLRKQGYLELRRYYTYMTNFFFVEALKPKGYSGSLDIYHNEKQVNGVLKKAKTLEIKVNPKCEESSSQQLYNDTRSLSGGERSYSTVAFILALWESANSPFKILDEVDVFMDMVTRKISLDAMIEFAAQKSGKQYIFLSPLRLQSLPNEELLKIYEMPEPERQTQ